MKVHEEPENEANMDVEQSYATRTVVWVQHNAFVTIVEEIFFKLKILMY